MKTTHDSPIQDYKEGGTDHPECREGYALLGIFTRAGYEGPSLSIFNTKYRGKTLEGKAVFPVFITREELKLRTKIPLIEPRKKATAKASAEKKPRKPRSPDKKQRVRRTAAEIAQGIHPDPRPPQRKSRWSPVWLENAEKSKKPNQPIVPMIVNNGIVPEWHLVESDRRTIRVSVIFPIKLRDGRKTENFVIPIDPLEDHLLAAEATIMRYDPKAGKNVPYQERWLILKSLWPQQVIGTTEEGWIKRTKDEDGSVFLS